MGQEPGFRGAYGLRLGGIEGAEDLLVPAAPEWPGAHLTWEHGNTPSDRHEVGPSAASLRLRTGGRLELDRESGVARFVVPHPLSTEELVHPYLVPVAAVLAHWNGRESVHAGAFVGANGVWGVVGDRGSGKSSTLARLALDGVGVVSDDLLILEGSTVYAGPRAIDLREEPAARLGVGVSIGVAGARERWRLRLGPVTDGLEIRGWIYLAWGARTEAVPVQGGERVARLAAQRTGGLPSLAPEVLLELASLPSWEVRRPRGWESLSDAADCLRELGLS